MAHITLSKGQKASQTGRRPLHARQHIRRARAASLFLLTEKRRRFASSTGCLNFYIVHMHAHVGLHKSREARVALLFHLEGARREKSSRRHQPTLLEKKCMMPLNFETFLAF